MNSMPEYDEAQLNALSKNINKFSENYADNHYFMLLCNDIKYYTVGMDSCQVNQRDGSVIW